MPIPYARAEGYLPQGYGLELRLDGVTSREDQVPGFAVG
jgi:hypothetical protein